MASPRGSRQPLLVLGILIATGCGAFFVIMRSTASFRGALPPTQTTRPASIIMSAAEFTTIPTGTGARIYIAGFDRDRPAAQRNINGVVQTEDITTDTALPSGATLTRCNYTGYFGTTPITVSVYCLQWTPSTAHIGTHPLAFRAREYDTGTFGTDVSTLTLIVNNASSSSTSSVQPLVSITTPRAGETFFVPTGSGTISIPVSYVTNQTPQQKTVVGVDANVAGTPLNAQSGTVIFPNIGPGTHTIRGYVIVRSTGQTILGTEVQFTVSVIGTTSSQSSSSFPSSSSSSRSSSSSSSSSAAQSSSSSRSSSSTSYTASIQLFYMNAEKICVKTGPYAERCTPFINPPFYSSTNILGTPSPRRMVVDGATGIAYILAMRYTDKAIFLYKADITTGQVEELCTNLLGNNTSFPRDQFPPDTLVLDADEQKLFWIEDKADIRWCSTGGSGSGFVLDQVVSGTTNSYSLIDIALHRIAKRIYWLQGPDTIGQGERSRSIRYDGTGVRTETMPTYTGPATGSIHYRNIGIQEANSSIFVAYTISYPTHQYVGWRGVPFLDRNDTGNIHSSLYDATTADLYWLRDGNGGGDYLEKTMNNGSTVDILHIVGEQTYPVKSLCLQTSQTSFCDPSSIGRNVSSSSRSSSSSQTSSSAASSSQSSLSAYSSSAISSSTSSLSSSAAIDLSRGIYYTKPDGLYRSTADSTEILKLFSMPQEVHALSVDAMNQRVYYAIDRIIYSADVRGRDVQIILDRTPYPNAYPVQKLFLDEQNNNLYFQDYSGLYKIALSLPPSQRTAILFKSCTVIQYLGSRCEYAVDPTRQLVYTLSIYAYNGNNYADLTSYNIATHVESASLIYQRFTPSPDLGIAGIAIERWPDYGIQFGITHGSTTDFYVIFPDFSSSLNLFGSFLAGFTLEGPWLAMNANGAAIYKNGNTWGSIPFLNNARSLIIKENQITVPLTASCGNGIVDGDEECDYGGENELYGCFTNCSTMIPPGSGQSTSSEAPHSITALDATTRIEWALDFNGPNALLQLSKKINGSFIPFSIEPMQCSSLRNEGRQILEATWQLAADNNRIVIREHCNVETLIGSGWWGVELRLISTTFLHTIDGITGASQLDITHP